MKNFTCREENGLYPSGSSSKLQINANKDFVFEEVDDDSVIQPIPFQFMSIREIKGSNLSSRVGKEFCILLRLYVIKIF